MGRFLIIFMCISMIPLSLTNWILLLIIDILSPCREFNINDLYDVFIGMKSCLHTNLNVKSHLRTESFGLIVTSASTLMAVYVTVLALKRNSRPNAYRNEYDGRQSMIFNFVITTWFLFIFPSTVLTMIQLFSGEIYSSPIFGEAVFMITSILCALILIYLQFRFLFTRV